MEAPLRFVRTCAIALAFAGAALITPAASLAASTGGIDNAGTTPGSATASPLALQGVLVLNQSETTTAGNQETILQVAGLNLLSKSGNGVNGGALAIAGTILDTLNHALCPKGTEAAGACIGLLFSNTTHTGMTNNASSATVALTLGKAHLRLLGSEASTTQTSSGQCVSTSLGYIANWENVTALPASALENGSIAGPGAC
jgi:hypothetical protein